MSSIRTIAIAASVTGVAALGFAPAAFATTSAAHITPANTTIKGALKSGTTLQFAGTVNGINLDVTCTTLTASGKTPANGLKTSLPTPPKFTGCTDSLTGTDTVVTTGKWALTANSTGSQLTLDIPVKGATFSSSLLSGCKIIVAPTKAGTITGKYDNKSTWTISGAKFAVDGSGCSTGPSATATGTVVFTPGFKVVS